jgi:hypothetical protein
MDMITRRVSADKDFVLLWREGGPLETIRHIICRIITQMHDLRGPPFDAAVANCEILIHAYKCVRRCERLVDILEHADFPVENWSI